MNANGQPRQYNGLARLLHWSVALLVFGLFALGYWMRTLDYYSAWYQRAPELHTSLGMVLVVLILVRLAWRAMTRTPAALPHSRLEALAGHAAHLALYVLLIVMGITGYVFATADGKPISVFGAFELPPLIQSKVAGDLAGDVHEWAAYAIVGLAVVHALAALKHHFIDRDDTLRRMTSGVTPRE
ncbi:MAG: cytochrome b [Pseudomonadota bacterium]